MYHPGKVLEVIRALDKDVVSSDASVQATVKMWDENVLTLLVAPKIASKLKSGQFVLVDYRPDPAHRPPTAAHVIVKIISGRKAEVVMAAYREMAERQKRQATPPAQSYIG